MEEDYCVFWTFVFFALSFSSFCFDCFALKLFNAISVFFKYFLKSINATWVWLHIIFKVNNRMPFAKRLPECVNFNKVSSFFLRYLIANISFIILFENVFKIKKEKNKKKLFNPFIWFSFILHRKLCGLRRVKWDLYKLERT